MSLSGTLSDQQSFTGSITQKSTKQSETNFFQKIDLLIAELEDVGKKVEDLGEECIVRCALFRVLSRKRITSINTWRESLKRTGNGLWASSYCSKARFKKR